MSDAGVTLLNPPATVLGNIDKCYLRSLEGRGFQIPRTRWLDHPDTAQVLEVMREERWEKAVLKPRIGATSHGTTLVRTAADLTGDALAPVRDSGGLMQEFLPEIQAAGELSLIFIGGAFSHAVRKRPVSGDFRVQVEFGGGSQPVSPTPAALVLGEALLATVPPPRVYARVDLVETHRGPLLMELELIEPELFFRYAPDAAGHMARVTLDWLNSGNSAPE
jgi:glutathione synthase/RimK-type ligase-like ATP-grasp enzyme